MHSEAEFYENRLFDVCYFCLRNFDFSSASRSDQTVEQYCKFSINYFFDNIKMQLDKYADLVKQLEDEELESCISAEHYIQLLAAYLYQNDLSNARYLWKRIPQNTKAGNKELEKIYTLCLALKNNNTADFFRGISYTWSPAIKDLMTDLEEKIRQDVFTLVGHAYTSIYENNLMELTALPQDKLREACEAREWTREQDAQQQSLVVPKVKVNEEPINTPSEELLYTLTEFVSFLEN